MTMRTFYTLIQAGVNPMAGDKITVGLFMRGADKPRFAWSRARARVVRDLMGADSYRLLMLNLKALHRQCEEEAQLSMGLFSSMPQEDLSKHLLSEPYMEYLSRYSRNLLSFGPLTSIEVEATDEHFHKLFALLVDDRADMVKQLPVRDIHEVREHFKMRTEKLVSWDVTMTKEELPQLVMPSVNIQFAGAKERMRIIGEVVDFEKPEYHLEKQLYELHDVAGALSAEKRYGSGYIIGDEPDKSMRPAQHRTWQAFRGSKLLKLVPSNESEQVDEALRASGVQPLDVAA